MSSAYNYSMHYTPGPNNVVTADVLSCLALTSLLHETEQTAVLGTHDAKF